MPTNENLNCGHSAEDDSVPETNVIAFGGNGYTICEECCDTMTQAIIDREECVSCGHRIVPYGESIIIDCDNDIPSPAMRYSRGLVLINGDGHEFAAEGFYSDNLGSVCANCCDDYACCENCGEYSESDDINCCDECESYFCNDYDCGEQHAECAMSSGGSIEDALARPGRTGNVIRSIRAAGIELERNNGGQWRTAGNELMNAGLLYESHTEHCGVEYVLLPMRGQALEQGIETAFDILRTNGMTGTDDCGAHFHLDMSQEDMPTILRIVAGLRIVEDLLFAGTEVRGVIGARRRMNWCRPTAGNYRLSIVDILRASEQASAAGTPASTPRGYRRNLADIVGQDTRYSSINTHAFSEHGTIEIRLLDAVLDADRMTAVIAIAAGIADYAASTTTGTLRAMIGNPQAMLYRAARAGFVAPSAMRFIEARFATVSAEIVAERREQERERIATLEREAIRARYNALTIAAREAYDAATLDATEALNNADRAASDVERAARAAYDAACDATRRIRRDAQTAHNLATAPARAERDRVQSILSNSMREEIRVSTNGGLVDDGSTTPRRCSCGCGATQI